MAKDFTVHGLTNPPTGNSDSRQVLAWIADCQWVILVKLADAHERGCEVGQQNAAQITEQARTSAEARRVLLEDAVTRAAEAVMADVRIRGRWLRFGIGIGLGVAIFLSSAGALRLMGLFGG